MSSLSPDALRERVLSAVPEWAEWPRKLRQLYALLPVYGTKGLADASGDLGWDWPSVRRCIDITPSFSALLTQFDTARGYPLIPMEAARNADSPAPWRLTHKEVISLLANEHTVLALVQIEMSGPDASPALAKIVAAAGHYANIEEAALERRAKAESRIAFSVSEDATYKAGKARSRSFARTHGDAPLTLFGSIARNPEPVPERQQEDAN